MPARSSWSRRNPVATSGARARALVVARTVARRRSRLGFPSVVLVGSWARGTARRHSDIDLVAVGSRSDHLTLYERGFFVTIKETTFAAESGEMRDPRRAGQAVLGWREAIPLLDSSRAAARLKRQALRFGWERLAPAADRSVAKDLVGWAEESVKLMRLMADGLHESAAVQRNLLVNAMAGVMAVRRRLLYNENDLWEQIGERTGPRWHRAQRSALGLGRTTFEGSCEAALELYRMTALECLDCLTVGQRAVVDRVCRAVGHPL
jgi:Nucleotidyltransferase domain